MNIPRQLQLTNRTAPMKRNMLARAQRGVNAPIPRTYTYDAANGSEKDRNNFYRKSPACNGICQVPHPCPRLVPSSRPRVLLQQSFRVTLRSR